MVDLRRLREAANLTQAELASQAGISQQAVGMIEKGQRNPSARTAIRLATVLKIDWTRFFDAEDDTHAHDDSPRMP